MIGLPPLTLVPGLVHERVSRQEAPRAEARPAAARATLDPAETLEEDFDFEAGKAAAASMMRREVEQMMLAGIADIETGARTGLPQAVEAYREFGE